MVSIAITSYTRKPSKRPKVAVVVVVDREPKDAILQAAFESLQVQTYPNIDVLAVDNRAAQLALGDARNRAVDNTDARYVVVMDQLDMLEPDAIGTMVDLLELNAKETPTLQHLTIGTMVQNKQGKRWLSKHRSPGIYKRAFLKATPFPVDPLECPEPFMRAVFNGHKDHLSIHVGHTFGYVYRDEPFRKDGFRS